MEFVIRLRNFVTTDISQMNTDRKLNKILDFLVDNKERINVNQHTIYQQIFKETITLREAEELVRKLRDSGKVRVIGSKYIGYSIGTEDFLKKGGFVGNRNFLNELFELLELGACDIAPLAKEFIKYGLAKKDDIVDALVKLDQAELIKIHGDYKMLLEEEAPVGFKLGANLTALGKSDGIPTLKAMSVFAGSLKQGALYKPVVFISYCWKEKDIADKIFSDLSQLGIEIKKDDHHLKYKDSIREFMQSIRDSGHAILIISDNYLKSQNCMTEVLHLLKEKNCFERILPVLIPGTRLFSVRDRLQYIQHWENQAKEISLSLKGMQPINTIDATNDLRQVTLISQQMGEFLQKISDMLHIPLAELQQSYYKPLLDKIGFEDMSFALLLLKIAYTEDLEQKEIALEKYAKEFPLNSYYYFLKGLTAARTKRFRLAKESYLQAIALDNRNFDALNNLGYILQYQFNEYNDAKAYYEKAIAINPLFTIARLNLGVLLGNLADYENAKAQYEAIILYDPTEPKAYHNLANYYKRMMNFDRDFEKIKMLYEKAIELQPDYVEAYMGYANLLKLNGRIEEGNKMYRKARAKDTTKYYTPLINSFLKTHKG